ncbi:MAG TPA: hypothetical protein VLJ82_16320, partial [Jatrophihabitans sp.]|nr:hypothetical protein [Jatrophihabitans sp.]
SPAGGSPADKPPADKSTDSAADRPPAEASAAGVTRSDIRSVTGADRLAELARMLAGNDSAVAREHAAQLLEAAREDLAGFAGEAPRPGRGRRSAQ